MDARTGILGHFNMSEKNTVIGIPLVIMFFVLTLIFIVSLKILFWILLIGLALTFMVSLKYS